jgi:hypothetical protein
MPLVESIVGFINDSLKAGSLKGIQPAKYIGVTTVLARKKRDDSLEILPAEMDLAGEYKMVEPNDQYSLIIYHKQTSNVYSTERNNSYGDGYNYKATTEMSVIVYADGKKLRRSAEQLEPLIIYGIPQRLGKALMAETKFNNCLITPLASVMDKISVFRQEYPNTEYFLKPYQHLFLIRYRIETTFDKNCINACLCGGQD